MKYLFAFILALLSMNGFAAIYMQADPEGNVVYSDTPDEHTKAIALPNTDNNISIPKSSAANAESTPQSTAVTGETGQHQSYKTFLITNPVNQETFSNQRDIPVTVKIDPALQEGDKVQLYVDGLPAGQPSADLTQLALHQVDRGEHQLSAALLDAADHVLNKTDNLSFFIHYSAIPTGSNAVTPSSLGGNGVTPSSPGSGITSPAEAGAGIIPPAQTGSGASTPAQAGSGLTPPPQSGSGLVPPSRYGSGIVPGH